MRFGSICSGVGFQEMAMKRCFGDKFESVFVSDVDRDAILSHAAIHTDFLEIKDNYNYPSDDTMWNFLENINFPLHHKTFEFIGRKLKGDKLKDAYLSAKITNNIGDFTKFDTKYLDDIDFLFASTPCQDFSVAGNQAGFDGVKGTLTHFLIKFMNELKCYDKLPEYFGFENVKAIQNKKHIEGFSLFLEELRKLGYNITYEVQNAKNYGVPQNRERIFVFGSLSSNIKMAKGFDVKIRLKDILEEEVDEKYYINKPFKLVNKKMVKAECYEEKFDQNKRVYGTDGYFQCLGAAERGTNKILIEAMIDNGSSYVETNKILDKSGICNTLTTMQGGRREPKILCESDYRIRKLTPLECWRLMGAADNDFYLAQKKCSNSQLYKQAGNGIVVDNLYYNFLKIKELKYKEEI